MEQVQANGPLGLVAAMFARELVEPAFEAAIEPEIIFAQREYFAPKNRVEQPVVKGDLDRNHFPGRRAVDDLPVVDKSESPMNTFSVGCDIRLDASTGEPAESLSQALVMVTAGVPIGRDQHIISRETHRPVDRPSLVERLHELADAEDKNILVPDGRTPV